MELGQRLRQARMEAGLSQRQLCAGRITRNMLSQIENGSARPSMDTLSFLAEQLGKPIGWFLEEEAVCSPNQPVMAAARVAFAAGEPGKVRQVLAGYQAPDPVFDWERWLMEARCAMALAEAALEKGRRPYAMELLEVAGAMGAKTPYFGAELERQRLLLLAQAGQPVELPVDDRELLLRAAQVMEADPRRAGEYLDAAQERNSAQWRLLRGRVYLAQEAYEQARGCFVGAQEAAPREAISALELCCREMGDYKGAYEYACKLRELS